MTITLAIEVSNPSASPGARAIALARVHDDGTIEELGAGVMPKNTRGSDGVMALIDRVCAEAAVPPAEIGAIAVSVGPGGYTALRIATTTAKVLARTLDCALIPVPTAEVASVRIQDEQLPAIITLASKGEKAWCAMVRADGRGGRLIEPLGVIEPGALEGSGAMHIFADSHLPAGFAAYADRHAIAVHPIMLDAGDCIRASLRRPSVAPSDLVPIYAREPDAVTQWRERHG